MNIMSKSNLPKFKLPWKTAYVSEKGFEFYQLIIFNGLVYQCSLKKEKVGEEVIRTVDYLMGMKLGSIVYIGQEGCPKSIEEMENMVIADIKDRIVSVEKNLNKMKLVVENFNES